MVMQPFKTTSNFIVTRLLHAVIKIISLQIEGMHSNWKVVMFL